MSASQVILMMIETIIIANFIGFLIRLFQKRYHFLTFLVAFALFPTFMFFLVIFPVFMPVFATSGQLEGLEKFRPLLRFFIGIILAPLAYVIIIGNFSEIADLSIWRVLDERDKSIRSMVENNIGIKSRYVKNDQGKLFAGSIMTSYSFTKNDLSHRVSHSIML